MWSKKTSKNLLKNVDGAILVFDLTNYQSYNKLKELIENLKKHLPSTNCMIIVGTKSDLTNNGVELELINQNIKTLGIEYIESSSKLNSNIINIFESFSLTLYNNFTKSILTSESNQDDNNSGGCKIQ